MVNKSAQWGALVASALLLILGPATAPAWAAQSPADTDWQPPPINLALTPSDGPPGPPPGITYQKSVGCISSGVGSVPLTDEPTPQSMLDIRDAQRISQGAGVTVAVIDTGVNPHPFLQGRIRGGGDYVDPSQGNGTTDCDGHGTIIAGIIAANTSAAGLGFTGVAPQATILAIRQTSDAYTTTNSATNTQQNAGNTSTLARAIVHATNEGASVITTSVNECLPANVAGATLSDPNSGDPELEAAVRYAVDHNVVVVNSAGNIPSAPDNTTAGSGESAQQNPCQNVPQNNNPDPHAVQQVEVPAVYAGDVLSVASVNPQTGDVSSFSEWGPWVSVAAPGEQITSIDPGINGTGLSNLYRPAGQNSTPGPIQGTSFAAPYVAGLAALIRSAYPTLSARQVMYRIEATAQHPSGPGGRNNQVGYGLINPVAALTAVIPGQNGVSAAQPTSIHAQLPGSAVTNSSAMRITAIAAGAAVAIALAAYFITRTLRHNRARRAGMKRSNGP